MAHSPGRIFRPWRLSRDDLRRLHHCISAGHGEGSLALCKNLRQLAALTEQRFDDDEVVDHLRLAVASSLLADLCEQDWLVAIHQNEISLSPPDWTKVSGLSGLNIKARVRSGLQLASDRQLASEAVQDFLRGMQRPRAFNGKVVSIATLVDDGAVLADRLKRLLSSDHATRIQGLRRAVDPYLQVCDDSGTCEFTGLPLLDIWRYFRHTWTLEYNSTPGRTLRFLIRNKGRADHPVIGIALLASPAANLYIRDAWIGWRLEDVRNGLISGSLDAATVGRALWNTLADAIADIRSDDLLSQEELHRPTEAALFKLRQIAGLANGRRRLELENQDDEGLDNVIDIRNFDKRKLDSDDYVKLSATPLFTKKRAEQLVPLLRAYMYMREKNFPIEPEAALYESLTEKAGKTIVSYILGVLRKRKIATEVADLAVCGAIEPYNHLLGGKLVALLMSSNEAREMYAARYANQVSEIASQMAGRPIIRSPDLSVLTTTSLYGIASSQYNRLKVTTGRARAVCEWKELGNSEGLTVTHVGRRTTLLMRKLGEAVYGARRINSVFGEGSSPRTRQIREGLNLIGINDDHVLRQSIGRRVYACEIVPNGRDALTGFRKRRKSRGATAQSLARAWVERWLVLRTLNPDVLASVERSGPALLEQALRERSISGKAVDDEQVSLALERANSPTNY